MEYNRYTILMKNLERIFKAVANRRRLAILAFLKNKHEATVGQIAEAIKLSFTATSRHLSVLRSADLIEKDQRGLEVYYSLEASPARLVKNILAEL